MEQTKEITNVFEAINSLFNGVTEIISKRINSESFLNDFFEAKNNAIKSQYEYTLNCYFYDVCYDLGVINIIQSLKLLCKYAIKLIQYTNKDVIKSIKLKNCFYEFTSNEEFAYKKMIEMKHSINEIEKIILNDTKNIGTILLTAVYIILIKIILFFKWVESQEYIPF